MSTSALNEQNLTNERKDSDEGRSEIGDMSENIAPE